jgi:hypothetical protein
LQVDNSISAEEMFMQQAVAFGAAKLDGTIVLPGSGVKIKATARELFQRVGLTNTMFIRGGAVVRVIEHDDQPVIDVLSAAAARSVFESYAGFLAHRVGKDGSLVLKPTVISQEIATALLESDEARDYLPHITGLVNCPVIVAAGGAVEIKGKGFHRDTGIFVTGGAVQDNVSLLDAREALRELVREFDFQSPGDRSRAIASFITPALKLGGHLTQNVPVDVAEADQSQSGKTYRQKLVAGVYNERPALVTSRSGGVGSVDESLNTQLIAGHPFIQLDNFRGRFDSPHIEALLTADKLFPVRVPHCRELMIDPRRFFIMLTSNGVDTTRDFANRASIIRIRKRVGHTYSHYPEGDLLQHVRARQAHYLGAVFAIVREWIERGCPRSSEVKHDFKEWATVLDYIMQGMMEGHEAAQVRVSSPDLGFLRNLALGAAHQERLGEPLNASALYEMCEAADVDVPRLREPDEDKGKRMIGTIMGRLFKDGDVVRVDGFTVTRAVTPTSRQYGGMYDAKTYVFERESR